MKCGSLQDGRSAPPWMAWRSMMPNRTSTGSATIVEELICLWPRVLPHSGDVAIESPSILTMRQGHRDRSARFKAPLESPFRPVDNALS